MRKVFKYRIPIDDSFVLKLPVGAKILMVQVQNQIPCIWALIDPDAVYEDRQFRLAGTGHPITEDNLAYIGSFRLYSWVIFHLFEVVL